MAPGSRPVWRRPRVLLAAAWLTTSCATSGPGGAPVPSAVPGPDDRAGAYRKLIGQLNTFRVTGAVRTDDGLLLPETIEITIRSEVCVESREPGSRFWSLDYDTCFAYVSIDSLSVTGEYSVSVPCLDADRRYESRHAFGDLRLVQRGPVSFLAESDAGWKHQETFTSSRSQRRDLILSLDTDTFWVITGEARFHRRADSGSEQLNSYPFGTGMEVIRFHRGWAECRMGSVVGWVEMRHLGTEAEMLRKRPLMGAPAPRRREIPP